MDIQQECVNAYRKHKNLKLAAIDVGIPWQSTYVHLRNAGEPVIGDKVRYGSDKDRLAAKGEALFKSLVPGAVDHNEEKYQSKLDFEVHGYSVDVKSSTLRLSNKACKLRRWAFSMKKQEMLADFFVCVCFGADGELSKIMLIPGEIVRKYATISLSEMGSKWDDYVVDPGSLDPFFKSLPPKSFGA